MHLRIDEIELMKYIYIYICLSKELYDNRENYSRKHYSVNIRYLWWSWCMMWMEGVKSERKSRQQGKKYSTKNTVTCHDIGGEEQS